MQGEYGLTTTWRLTVKPPSKEPPFFIVMQGLTLLPHCKPGLWLQVEWTDPPGRVVQTNTVYLPDSKRWLKAFNPVLLNQQHRRQSLLLAALAVAVPVALIAGVAIVLSDYDFFVSR